ncbi:apple domain-containing protein [Caerostris darwini]|uniref:Apple domain-containing protein n=1 Tax=Caerostris darwini TaxID=1538125 RepID=A0AAV4T7T2_9ARAC|nr:apple domain-containing protein [Caerostris darwini]
MVCADSGPTVTKRKMTFPLAKSVSMSNALRENRPNDCSFEKQSFELVTGFVFTAPDDTLELVPGTLHLTECLSYCRHNASCRAVNFETGLCVLFSSSATDRPEALTSSQFPVFTIYAQKICLQGESAAAFIYELYALP